MITSESNRNIKGTTNEIHNNKVNTSCAEINITKERVNERQNSYKSLHTQNKIPQSSKIWEVYDLEQIKSLMKREIQYIDELKS